MLRSIQLTDLLKILAWKTKPSWLSYVFLKVTFNEHVIREVRSSSLITHIVQWTCYLQIRQFLAWTPERHSALTADLEAYTYDTKVLCIGLVRNITMEIRAASDCFGRRLFKT